MTLLLKYHPDLELRSTYVQMILIMFSLFMCKVGGCSDKLILSEQLIKAFQRILPY